METRRRERREWPLLMKPYLLRATFDDYKVQTRRVVSPRNSLLDGKPWPRSIKPGDLIWENARTNNIRLASGKLKAEILIRHKSGWLLTITPKYQAGDLLWVKEAWGALHQFDVLKPSEIPNYAEILYRLDQHDHPSVWKWRSPLFMPKRCCRLWLTIYEVGAERIQEITTESIIAEGLSSSLREHDAVVDLLEQWIKLWNEINDDRGFGWDVNPWVWPIEYARLVRKPGPIEKE